MDNVTFVDDFDGKKLREDINTRQGDDDDDNP
jgi:hypothetical protein